MTEAEACWFFSVGADGVVHLRARFESDGFVGDAHHEVSPGEDFHGIPHAALKAAGGGKVRFTDGGEAVIGT